MDESVIKHLENDHMADVTRLLLRAADIMDAGGQCKGRAQLDTAYCLSGAVSAACMENVGSWDFWKGHDACFERIKKHFDDENPIEWNDAPERTKDEVVAKLRAVALGG